MTSSFSSMEKRNVEGLLDTLGAQIACFQGQYCPFPALTGIQELTGRTQDATSSTRKVLCLSRTI
jgi:hypothetical protein